MAKRLTIKQQEFVGRYLENGGNGTRAALDVYDTEDPNVANAISSENLRKPMIQEELRRLLSKEELGLSRILDNVSAIANTLPLKVSAETALKANIELLKLHGVYNQPTIERSYKTRIQKMGRNELRELLVEETARVTQVLNEFPD